LIINQTNPDNIFPIVGIGASAGGLEALKAFFHALPSNTGLGFVLIVHLDPDHTSLLPELIQNITKMPVLHAEDNIRVEANSVYVIPPNKEITILNGILQLFELKKPHGLSRPIDTFFHALAQDHGKNSIAIILSGTGSDGSMGLRAIKGEAGTVLVQEPESAGYDGMPRNAIATGLVDEVLPPELMPTQLQKLTEYLNKDILESAKYDNKNILNALEKIYVLIRAKTGHDFSLYKKNTICRRIERRMQMHQIDNIDDYVRFLQENESEILVLFKELLIGVTSFFRDTDAFTLLENDYLPRLIEEKPDDYLLRIWVAGCSTGEEAYSIAIILHECMERLKRHLNIQIFGTDIDEVAIERARSGLFPKTISAEISPKRLKRFFIKEDNHYRVKKVIREMLVFAPQNMIKDPPFTKLDLLSCRNLLIYFGSELQKKLLPVFHYSLNSQGLLFLGSSESLGDSADMFTILDKKWKIYQRMSSNLTKHPSLTLTTPHNVLPPMTENKKVLPPDLTVEKDTLKLLKAILAESGMSARVIIDNLANIVYIHGKTGKYLEPAEGAVSVNIIEMARPGLKAGLMNGIQQVTSQGKTIQLKDMQIESEAGYIPVHIQIKPISSIQVEQQGLMMVVFEEVTKDVGKVNSDDEQNKSDEVKRLENELEFTRENLQSTIEELEASNEELKSTNEELQSTNEELQSTNEELETSKEELQSLNEESTTVNTELQSRIDELMDAKDDIKNLLDAAEIASIFLDINLNVRRFTPKALSIFPLTEADIGRPIQHFASNLMNVELLQFAEQVLNDLSMQEEEVLDKDGKSYRMRIRPYRTISNVIDGVVITFEDITQIKRIESELNQTSDNFEVNLLMMSKVFMDGADPIIIEDLDGNIINVNSETIRCYGWPEDELIGKNMKKLIPAKYQSQAAQSLKSCIENKQPVRNIEGLRLHKSGKTIKVLLTYSLLTDLQGEICAIATIAKNYPNPVPSDNP